MSPGFDDGRLRTEAGDGCMAWTLQGFFDTEIVWQVQMPSASGTLGPVPVRLSSQEGIVWFQCLSHFLKCACFWNRSPNAVETSRVFSKGYALARPIYIYIFMIYDI